MMHMILLKEYHANHFNQVNHSGDNVFTRDKQPVVTFAQQPATFLYL